MTEKLNHKSDPPTRSWLERLSDMLLREPQDKEQLIHLLRDAAQRQVLDANALAMIEGVLQVSSKQVRDIMIPRSQMIVISEEEPLEKFLPTIIESEHSRYPVIGENRDEVIGILLAKDLLGVILNRDSQSKFNLREILRVAVFVPESKRLDVLLHEFRISRNHMAIVVDEYGGVAGLVTIEDVLEEIVGDIADEYDIDEEPFIKKVNDKQFAVKALTPLEKFNEYFNSNFEEDCDTIGGLLMQNFGHVPKLGETLKLENLEFKVIGADDRRIRTLQVTRLDDSD